MTKREWKRQDRQRRQRRWLRYQEELMRTSFSWYWEKGKCTRDTSAQDELKLKHYGRPL